jgi:hypothetical protein
MARDDPAADANSVGGSEFDLRARTLSWIDPNYLIGGMPLA